MDKKTVLIVDDSKDIFTLIQRALRDLNLRFFTATDGMEALEIFEREKIDLVITDTNMPGLSGVDLLLDVRNTRSALPIIVLFNGYQKNPTLTESTIISLGATAVINKDRIIQEIASLVSQCFDGNN